MSFRIPTAERNAKAREAMGDVAIVAEILNPANIAKLECRSNAVRRARRTIEESNGAIRAINLIALDSATDQRWLIQVGPRGGWRKLWNFGTGRD